MSDISVFANFFINDQTRINELKLSLNSFYKAEINSWFINIRGKKKKEARKILLKKIPSSKVKFFSLDSKKGWMHDSSKISKNIKTKYIFFWVEDHICIGGIKYFNEIIKSVIINDIDYMPYSWFFFKNNIKSIKFLKPKEDKNIFYLNYTRDSHKKRLNFWKKKKLTLDIYIISCCSIMKTTLFRKLLTSRDKLFLKWSSKLPFNFEKDQNDDHWLPYKLALPKKELFVSYDDNLGCSNYSLLDRKKKSNVYKKIKNVKIVKNKVNFNFYQKQKIMIKKLINFLFILLFKIKK